MYHARHFLYHVTDKLSLFVFQVPAVALPVRGDLGDVGPGPPVPHLLPGEQVALREGQAAGHVPDAILGQVVGPDLCGKLIHCRGPFLLHWSKI